jgi:hypothetical protein
MAVDDDLTAGNVADALAALLIDLVLGDGEHKPRAGNDQDSSVSAPPG